MFTILWTTSYSSIHKYYKWNPLFIFWIWVLLPETFPWTILKISFSSRILKFFFFFFEELQSQGNPKFGIQFQNPSQIYCSDRWLDSPVQATLCSAVFKSLNYYKWGSEKCVNSNCTGLLKVFVLGEIEEEIFL